MFAMRSHTPPLAAIVLTCVLVGGAAGCGKSVDPSVALTDAEQRADVDPDLGTIVLPVERYLLSGAEVHRLGTARKRLIGECAIPAGVQQSFESIEYVPETDRRYGIWVEREAAVYGYGLGDGFRAIDSTGSEPPSDGRDAGSLTPDEELAVIEECLKHEEITALNFEAIQPGFNYGEVFGSITDDVFASEEGEEVFADWEQCLAGKQLQRDLNVSPYAVKGATLEPTEQSIRIALADVGCKRDVRFVERLAALEAQQQAPLVARYHGELTEMRADYDRLLARADEILATSS